MVIPRCAISAGAVLLATCVSLSPRTLAASQTVEQILEISERLGTAEGVAIICAQSPVGGDDVALDWFDLAYSLREIMHEYANLLTPEEENTLVAAMRAFHDRSVDQQQDPKRIRGHGLGCSQAMARKIDDAIGAHRGWLRQQ